MGSLINLGTFQAIVFVGVLGSVFTFGILLASFLYEKELTILEDAQRQSELERLLAQADLRRLQGQMRPHFLFNSLNLIQRLIYLEQSDAAAGATVALGHLLRASLRDTEGTVSLEDELALVTDYLQIQRLRFGNRIHVSVEVPPHLLATPLPPFTLQPLVENAVVHGIEPLAHGGTIRITARESEGHVVVSVSDSGVGIDPAALAANRDESSRGIGIPNVDGRLRLTFGPAYGLEVERIDPAGTCARIRLPSPSVRGVELRDPSTAR